MQDDNRQKLIDDINSRLLSGDPMDTDEMGFYLKLACTYSVLYATREAVSGNPVSKARTRELNCLKNALSRHEMLHPDRGGDKGKIEWSMFSTEDGEITYTGPAPEQSDDPN